NRRRIGAPSLFWLRPCSPIFSPAPANRLSLKKFSFWHRVCSCLARNDKPVGVPPTAVARPRAKALKNVRRYPPIVLGRFFYGHRPWWPPCGPSLERR